jgi:hypothetical protein
MLYAFICINSISHDAKFLAKKIDAMTYGVTLVFPVTMITVNFVNIFPGSNVCSVCSVFYDSSPAQPITSPFAAILKTTNNSLAILLLVKLHLTHICLEMWPIK